MNAPAGIEPDKDRVAPVGRQRELNSVDNAFPPPAPPNQADRFADLQVGSFHAGWNRFVFNCHFFESTASRQAREQWNNRSSTPPNHRPERSDSIETAFGNFAEEEVAARPYGAGARAGVLTGRLGRDAPVFLDDLSFEAKST